ncbi:MAG: hypothetical protein ACOYL4_03285 [Miltoncostaeaceae bacterium]
MGCGRRLSTCSGVHGLDPVFSTTVTKLLAVILVTGVAVRGRIADRPAPGSALG